MASLLALPATSPHRPAFSGAFFLPRSFSPRLFKSSIKCRYAEVGVSDDSRPAAIDIAADIKSEQVVVLGGNGFVGSAICKTAVSNGIEVISLNRSGRPSSPESWVDQVTWVSGDVFYANWDEVLPGATAVVSSIGGLGNEEQMKRINAEANAVAVNAAKDFGIPKFILISVHDYKLPPLPLIEVFATAKRKAESEVLSKYPNTGVVLRPGIIYGKKRLFGVEIPVDLVEEPLERILSATENFVKPLRSLPLSDIFLAPPVSINDVALSVVNAVKDDDVFGVFTIEQIKKAAAKVKA